MNFSKYLLLTAVVSFMLPLSGFCGDDMVLKLNGINGSSFLAGYPNQIRITGFSCGAALDSDLKPTLQQLTFSKYVDASTPALYTACLKQQTISSGTFTVVRNDSLGAATASSLAKVYTIVLAGVQITAVSQKAGPDAELIEESITLSCQSITWNYYVPTTGAIPTVVTGSYTVPIDTY
jgi:type VI secretion system Hcp family effector